MRTVNGNAPTPAKRIRELMTTNVILPLLSKQAGEPVAVRVRMLSRQERQEIMEPLPTSRMTMEELQQFIAQLNGQQRADYQRQADEADEQLILVAVIAPKVASGADGDPETTIPMAAVWPDRVTLILEILRFSGFLALPWEPATALAEIQPEPSAGKEAGSAEPFRADAATGPLGDPSGGGGALPAAGAVPAEGAAG